MSWARFRLRGVCSVETGPKLIDRRSRGQFRGRGSTVMTAPVRPLLLRWLFARYPDQFDEAVGVLLGLGVGLVERGLEADAVPVLGLVVPDVVADLEVPGVDAQV